MAETKTDFSFEISLSVLNHLGRNLYRNFLTVLGEAISNSWDADAENVHIFIDKKKNSFVIKDDGIGMTAKDFQDKFLKIGYSKRKEQVTSTLKHRPYVGRKGIGKLALLSCANKIYILTKTQNTEITGGIIDNSGLDDAIKSDMTPDKYKLGEINFQNFSTLTQNFNQGTILYFDGIKDGIKNSIDQLRNLLALYFRFSLVDNDFNIYVQDKIISLDELDGLVSNTQFLWNINNLKDPFVSEKLLRSEKLLEKETIESKAKFTGFIASVAFPKDLKVVSTDEKLSVDLFVNGRLREKDILKHIPTARIVENYLYGQIHYNELEGEIDRFTSSREGIVADDPVFKKFLEDLREILTTIINDWDSFRIKHRNDGDPESNRISKRERKSRELFNAVSFDFSLPNDSPNKKRIDSWVDDLGEDAQYNFTSYAECFISENLIRRYLDENKIPLTTEALRDITRFRQNTQNSLDKANLSIPLRVNENDLSFLDMDGLAYLADNQKDGTPCLARDADNYKPMRDALMHTSRLTDLAKSRLNSVYENIKNRINILLKNSK